jgi:hypothetical protein
METLYSNLAKLSEASHFGFVDPVLLRRIFVLFARDLFSDPDNYAEYTSLRDLVYTDVKSSRTLDVDLDFIYDPEEISKKPSVYVGTDDYAFKKQVIDNYNETPSDSVTSVTAETSTRVIIKHISTEVDVSLMLATLSTNYFTAIRPIMFKHIPHILSYETQMLSKPNLIEGSKIKAFQTNVTIGLAFNAAWTIIEESHLIKSVHTDLNPTG